MKSFKERFLELKLDLKVGKNVENKFGGFQYRTKPQIEELLKPLQKEHQIIITTTSVLIELAGRVFVQSTATAYDVLSDETFTATANAELQAKVGTKMSEPQLTGSSESYAGKYALGNLLGIDDNDDPDKGSHNPDGENIPTNEDQAKVLVTKGSKEVQDIVALRQSIVALTDAEVTPSVVNAKLDEINNKFNGDSPAQMILSAKAKKVGLRYNENTNKWEGQ